MFCKELQEVAILVKVIVGENDDEDIKKTIMDPNTRTLIQVNIGDIENDMQIFQLLRGGSPIDALNRKTMMKQFKIDKSLIDL